MSLLRAVYLEEKSLQEFTSGKEKNMERFLQELLIGIHVFESPGKQIHTLNFFTIKQIPGHKQETQS